MLPHPVPEPVSPAPVVRAGVVRTACWRASRRRDRFARLLERRNRAFARLVVADGLRFAFRQVRPIPGETRARACAAADWLMRAHDAAPDDGVSRGYFPCDEIRGWSGSHVETTGGVVTSLVDYWRSQHDPDVRERALRMAIWHIGIQLPNGAVDQSGGRAGDERPCAFATGRALDGWISAHAVTGRPPYLAAARRAAEFLTADLGEEGTFRTICRPSRPSPTAQCAWALYRAGLASGRKAYCRAALRAVDSVLHLQQVNGWFAPGRVASPRAPLVHTIAGALQGVLEVGLLAGRSDLLDAARRGTAPLIAAVRRDGFLPGRFDRDWRPVVRWSCLSGSAQLAVVCYRLFEHDRDLRYLDAADRLLDFLKALQPLGPAEAPYRGALPGSHPVAGGCTPLRFPNWATKYLLDALLLQARIVGTRGH
jgi:hypothetical protein